MKKKVLCSYSEGVSAMLFHPNGNVKNNDFKNSILEVKKMINSANYENARNRLCDLLSLNSENPLIYNLIGVTYELEGNRVKASKFYRMAYFLDQTFTSAANNLNRVGQFYYGGSGSVDLGIDEGGEIKWK